MPTPSPFANPIFCAIDRPDLPGALALARALEGAVGGLKVGLELFTATGPDGARAMIAEGLPVFLDLKLHDIPNTVAGAVRAACALRPAMLTLHAAGGGAMLRAAVDAAGAERPWLLGVTLLTSLGPAELTALGIARAAEEQVLRMAELCAACGLDGVICSPHEIAALRRRFGADLKLVVPGIRGAADAVGDQRRIMPAADALALGADVLVVGRPITAAPDPRAAALELLAALPRAA
jgi:orotidine-5'-phosphate decarboxylase